MKVGDVKRNEHQQTGDEQRLSVSTDVVPELFAGIA
jgi:hypothetical protein